MKNKDYLLFDLDGTLTDPKEGITKAVQYALKHYGIQVDDLDSLCPFIGPPLKDSFQKYYGNLLGGLYRENPVKSRNYEAVKSSKKWENVGNSYIIPALLLYRYSYI